MAKHQAPEVAITWSYGVSAMASCHGAWKSPSRRHQRPNPQSSSGAKISEAESKVCASEKHVQAARSSFNKGSAAAKSSQAISLFRSAFQNAVSGINTLANITGDWSGVLTVVVAGKSAKLEFHANLIQTNTAISDTFGDSVTAVGTVTATICGVSLNQFNLSFESGSASGTGKTNAAGSSLTIRPSGADSDIPFKTSGTIRK